MGATRAQIEGLTEPVAHLIGAHSMAFSPVPPRTLEAVTLRHADYVVAQSLYLMQDLDMERVISESMARLT